MAIKSVVGLVLGLTPSSFLTPRILPILTSRIAASNQLRSWIFFLCWPVYYVRIPISGDAGQHVAQEAR